MQHSMDHGLISVVQMVLVNLDVVPHPLTPPAPIAEVICTWSGQLPPKRHKNPTYSPRVFLGGVPWDITEASLIAGFRPFGNLAVDWPGKEGKHNRHPPKGEGRRLQEGRGGGVEEGCSYIRMCRVRLHAVYPYCGDKLLVVSGGLLAGERRVAAGGEEGWVSD